MASYFSISIEKAKKNPYEAYVLTNDTYQVKDDTGVRIGPLDLKYVNLDMMKKLGLNPDMIDLLQPYIGVQGQEALDLVKTRPLKLTRDQYETLSSRMKSYNQQLYDSLPESDKKEPIIERLTQLANEEKWPEYLDLNEKFLEAPRIMVRGSLQTAIPFNMNEH
ncbi:unnamed protein product [Brachionus calyciflorus]|uniref:Pesticin C-terminal domain-containing protein n=1 Tax=Brachionus calyciflorus TaxID=104777 RepID=A0A813PE12_9BILA|nr:unnamed protein product [Brachionus calyciflorus]